MVSINDENPDEIQLEKNEKERLKWISESEYKKYLSKKNEDSNRNLEIEFEKRAKQNKYFKMYQIDYLYHITHKNNIKSISKNGLKSRNNLINNDKNFEDNCSILDLVDNRNINDYVRLFFNPKNSFLICENNTEDDFVIIGIDRNALYWENTIFTDGNAALDATSFYKKAEDLSKLNWDYLNDDQLDLVNKEKCAEILVLKIISSSAMKKIFCKNEETRKFIASQLNTYSTTKPEVNPSLFFKKELKQKVSEENVSLFNNRMSAEEIDDLPF